MKSAVIVFPGSNREGDIVHAIRSATGSEPAIVWHAEATLPAADLVVLPGGYGTLDELFEALTLVQTSKVDPVPIILYDSAFWGGLVEWIKGTLLTDYATISPKDPDLVHLADTPQEVVDIIDRFYAKSILRPNF